jgi:hypothetical protein
VTFPKGVTFSRLSYPKPDLAARAQLKQVPCVWRSISLWYRSVIRYNAGGFFAARR